MRKLGFWIFGFWMSVGAAALADSGPVSSAVLVELYTSQGCSSCPPADEFLGRLAKRDDVIALSLHVDYWDYIGWKDSFARPKFSKRQHSYAYAAGKNMVFTPQMVINGQDMAGGTKFAKVKALIKTRQQETSPVQLVLERNGQTLVIKAQTDYAPLEMVVQLVRYTDGEKVMIKRGENAGRKIRYHNVVTDWNVLTHWNGTQPLSICAEISGDDAVVVVVQTAGYGPVLATARLR